MAKAKVTATPATSNPETSTIIHEVGVRSIQVGEQAKAIFELLEKARDSCEDPTPQIIAGISLARSIYSLNDQNYDALDQVEKRM